MNIEIIDWIIIGVVAVGTVLGFAKGALKQLASLVGLVAGLLLARALYVTVGERMAVEFGTSATVAQIIAFFLIWILVPIALLWVASLLSRVLEVVHLGILNRLAGALFGGVKYTLIVSMAIQLIEFIDPKGDLVSQNIRKDSILYDEMEEVGDVFVPTIKNMTKELFEKDII